MDVPTADLFSEVLSHSGSNWFDIGLYLGASVTDLKEIRQNFTMYGTITCLAELHDCLVKKGEPLTWDAIATALRRLDNHTLADSIHCNYILPAIRRASLNEDTQNNITTSITTIGTTRGDAVTNVRESSIYGTGGGVDRGPECGACRTKEEQIKQLHIDADALQQKYDNLTAEYNAYKMKKDTDVKVLVRQLKEKDAAFIELTKENEQLKDKPKFHAQVDYFQVFVNHFDDLVEVVTFPLSLAQGLRRAKLVPQQAVDSILNSKEPQDLVITRLLKEVRNLLKISKKHPEQLRARIITLCQVLSDQDNPALSDIATDILGECALV